MSLIKGLAQLLGALMVLALFLGVVLFVVTLAWMARFVFLLIAIVAVIMYALSELFTGFRKKRRSS